VVVEVLARVGMTLLAGVASAPFLLRATDRSLAKLQRIAWYATGFCILVCLLVMFHSGSGEWFPKHTYGP
jgi:hypothetical protein